jgi:uncharacterized protein YecT (DUF1311 family)
MMKIKQRLSTLGYGIAIAMLFASSAHATNDPDWWVEDSESLPRYSDYGLFTLTPDESESFISKADVPCRLKADDDKTKLLACHKKKYTRIEKRLNKSYQKLMAALPSHRQQTLEQEQENWLSVRWKNCDADIHAEYFRASEAGITFDTCANGELARRTQWIEQYHGFAQRKR